MNKIQYIERPTVFTAVKWTGSNYDEVLSSVSLGGDASLTDNNDGTLTFHDTFVTQTIESGAYVAPTGMVAAVDIAVHQLVDGDGPREYHVS
jgi:hypothetical protein